MSTTDDLDRLGDLLQECGVGWLLDESRDERLRAVLSEIGALASEINGRMPSRRVNVLEEMLAEPVALRPLVQMLASPTSIQMRAMAYCVLRGLDIKEVHLAYKRKDSVSLVVVLEDPATEAELRFESSDVWDVATLRHMGILALAGKPILQGFYAFAP